MSRRRRARAFAPAPALALVLALGGCGLESGPEAGQVSAGAERAARPIVDGTPTTGDPAVVAIGSRRVGCDEPFQARCTGALIAPRVVLTAAHCVFDPRLGDALEVMFGSDVTAPEARFRRVVEVGLHPDYGGEGDVADLAALVLDRAADATPLGLADPAAAGPAVGDSVRVVGFGQASASEPETGRKRTGDARVIAVEEAQFTIAADPALTCRGDSGGPTLAPRGGAEVIVGVTSRGDTACAEDGIAVRVDRYREGFIQPWIEAAAGPGPDWTSAVPAEALCTGACVDDTDCPDGLVCRDGASLYDAGARCVIPGLLAGTLGAACTDDAQCDERCVRAVVEAADDGTGACRCYRACTPPSAPGPSTGCSARSGAYDLFPTYGVFLLTLVFRSRKTRKKPFPAPRRFE